ncbi:MAG: biotin-dependent carboxyltransferase family protein [Granulosicoccus sp.]
MIEVLSIPPLATVQDLGRQGHWFQGLGQAGVMDDLSHRIANLVLGNDETAATLEIPLAPVRFRFHTETAFAISGAVCNARLDSRALPAICAGVAKADQVLQLKGISQGARVYLALPGGIDVPIVLGSRSTQLRESFGGFDGRMLKAGDQLRSINDTWPDLPASGLSLGMPPLKRDGSNDIELRVLPSAEYDYFASESLTAFWSSAYRVSPASNRQGYRLEGQALSWMSTTELRSHGIVPGIIQVPGSGQPIIQLADTATMGGYPAIGAVIEPDLWRIAQARPGEFLRFVRVDLDEAANAALEQQDILASLNTYLIETRELLSSWNS